MNMQQPQNRNFFEDAKGLMSWMTLIVQTLATSVQPFLHCRFGERYFGMQALAVLILIPLYSLCWEGAAMIAWHVRSKVSGGRSIPSAMQVAQSPAASFVRRKTSPCSEITA